VQTATYTFQDTAELIAYQEGRYGSYEYGRYGNPTTRAAEEKIRELEGAEDCLVSSSGMNAATTMLLALVPAGGHIVTTTDCYRRTRQFIQTVLPKMGITATVIDPADLPALERALEEHTVSAGVRGRCTRGGGGGGIKKKSQVFACRAWEHLSKPGQAG
jgi:cystathionine gamma-synthase